MKCVLLAAGRGKRLRPLTNRTPKCLLPVGGKPLLERTYNNLMEAGIRDIAVVTGFKASAVRTFLMERKRRGVILTFIHNAHYRQTNNAYSLSLTADYAGGKPFLLLDCDILFGTGLLPAVLTAQRKPNRLAVRVKGEHDEEEIRVKIDKWEHILEIGKHIPLRESYGESIGMEVFSEEASGILFEILRKRTRSKRGRMEFYEAAFQQLISGGTHLWALDVSGHPTAEIDTHEDLLSAEHEIIPRLDHA